jgi:osmotically inducible protein OsmC
MDMAIAQRSSIAERSAQTTWTGPLGTGRGAVTTGSGALEALPVTWAARTSRPHGMTSPEELAAAAHSSCFSMALALRLGERDITPERLEVTATVSLADVDGRPTIVSSAVRVVGQIVDLDGETFRAIVHEAEALCPISRLFAGAAITVSAYLDGMWDE